jgi:peptidoglycan/xylan/chitin deacetylase (PgdA/CDA1 family)
VHFEAPLGACAVFSRFHGDVCAPDRICSPIISPASAERLDFQIPGRPDRQVGAFRIPSTAPSPRRIVAEGHEIANHTYSLPDLKRLSPQGIVREIRAAEEAIVRVAGVKPKFFRATNGELNESLRDLVQKEGYAVLDSTLDSGDWRNPSQAKLMRVILDGAKPGSVILAHENFPKSAKQMPAVSDALVKRGFVFCTASELRPPASPLVPAP